MRFIASQKAYVVYHNKFSSIIKLVHLWWYWSVKLLYIYL